MTLKALPKILKAENRKLKSLSRKFGKLKIES